MVCVRVAVRRWFAIRICFGWRCRADLYLLCGKHLRLFIHLGIDDHARTDFQICSRGSLRTSYVLGRLFQHDNFGLAFFLLNLPFFYLSWRRLGMAFTIKTFIAIGLTSVIADVQSRFRSVAV